MTLISKWILTSIILLAGLTSNAQNRQADVAQSLKSYQQACEQDGSLAKFSHSVVFKFVDATLAAGRCTGSYDCSWPTTQCVGNRCVKPNGDGGECSGSYDCSWPTSQCRNGNCVKPNGDGGECTGSYDCSWPYSQCKNGNCERP